MNEPQGELPRQRRVRYKGTHPRHFQEKYKELAPQNYGEDVLRVLERGQTPAGTHRPICVDEILQVLHPTSGEVGLDATLGYGGHAQRLLERIAPGGHLYGLDVDPLELPRTEARLRARGYGPEILTVRRMNFAGIQRMVAEAGRPFDFILADLGVSSMQIDNPARGFTYKVDGPLDLRLNPSRGKSAAEYLVGLNVEKLERILRENADEPHAEPIARAIVAQADSQGQPMRSTVELRQCIESALAFLPGVGRREQVKKSCQRVFQALRIAVNDEFVVLDQFLEQLPLSLAPGGRVAVLTFHSGEDRRVKKSFQERVRTGVYSEFSREPIRPSAQECRANPRSSCAKLRWAVNAG